MKITQKRILSLLLSAALIFAGLPMTAMAEEELLIQNSGEPIALSIDVGNISENSAEIAFSASTDGTVYYTVCQSGEQPPEEAVLLTKETVAVTEGSASVVAAELAAQTGYTVYALLEDAAGKRSTVAAKEFTTEDEAGMESEANSPVAAQPPTMAGPALLTPNAGYRAGEPVPYLDDKGAEQTCDVYTKLTAEYILSNSSTLTDGWYVVDSTFTYANRITISGDVHIILTDSANMTASKGITVEGSNSLTIYGQSGGTGKLTVTGSKDGDAGIGGGESSAGGTITINGGTVTAKSGVQGAGIGGGDDGAGGNITINGGMVTATSNNFGAGIGGGLGGAGGTIVISGDAEVKATGGSGFSGSVFALGGGAGIGSGGGISNYIHDGNSPASGSITISGNANVTSQGGGGDSSNAVKAHGGAGIGSGGAAGTGSSADSLGTITINTTGTVNATGGVDVGGANPGTNIGAGGSQSGAGTEWSGNPVPYLDDKGVEQSRAVYTKLTAEYLSSNSSMLNSGWYVVDSTFTYGDRIIFISGDVHIILTDSANMTASKAIAVTGSNSLTLYGQSGGTGKLTATGGPQDAGIGGGLDGAGGTITINGGAVKVTGGIGGAGIGGGRRGAGGTITINGGTVNATGGQCGAGIGGGDVGAGGAIAISGEAKVTATGGQCSAGIGGGYGSTGGTITINGDAEVKATGGIGFSDSTFAVGGGAAIGSGGGKSDTSGGNPPASGTITITENANVTAQGGAGDGSNTIKGHGGAGIGSGGAAGSGDSAGSVGTITINTTGTVNAIGGAGDNNGANLGADIGAGGSQSGAGKPYYTITIDTQPAGNTTVTQGSITESLSVSASVSPNGVPAYEWFSSKTNSSTGGVSTSVKTPSFTIPTDLTAGDHYYYCVVSAMGAASVPSSVATVTVTAAQPMTHTISASAGANGSISPSSNISVIKGANQTFAITPNSGYSIRDVKVDGTSVGAASSYAFSNVTENHTIHAEFYYSYSGGGGGGSGGGMTVPKTNITTDKQPDMPTVANMSVSGTVKDGILSATITEQMVKDAIKAAQDAAEKSGKTLDGIAVDFNVIGSGSYTNLNAMIEAGAIDRLKESGVKFIKIGSSVLDVTFDTGAIAEVDNQSTGTVTVSARKLTKLSDAAKKLIGNRPVFDITVSYQKNGKAEYVSKFGKGIVTLGISYEATGGENKGHLFGVYVDKNGKPQLLNNSSYDNTGRLIFSRNSLSTYGVGYKAPAPTFTDTAKHWAKDHIDFVVSRGLITGSSESTFTPNTAITRADFLMALGRLSGADGSSYKTSSFTDVKNTDTAMPYIEWAVKNKIVQGIGSGKFRPNDSITREQMAVMMQNYATATGYKLPVSRQSITFADDAKISAYAKAAVKAIQQTGVVGGKGNNLFDPQGNATRAEASTILRRFVELVIDEGTARGWVQNDAGQWQYIGENGKPAIGWLTTESGKYHYYFTVDGSMVAGKWLEIEGKRYYFNADGSLAKSTKIDGYEVDENGVRKVK